MTDTKNTTLPSAEEEGTIIEMARTHGAANVLALLKEIEADVPIEEATTRFLKRADARRKRRERDPRVRRPMVVPVTPNPRRIMRPFGEGVERETINMAVMEGEFLARALEHKEMTPALANVLRFLMAGACLYVAKHLDTHHVDAQLFRDLYPYARATHPQLREAFEMFCVDMRRDAPKLYASMTGTKMKKGGVR